MLPHKTILAFFGKFVLVYALLILPWPGINPVYGRIFRSIGNLTFSRESGRRLLKFEPVPESLRHLLDTRILLANREVVDAHGNTPVIYLELDTRAVGWIPTAMLLALTVATPMAWPRKARVFLWGMPAVHAYILFSLAIYIWNNSTDLGLLVLSPLAGQVTAGLEETLITQMGATFVVPVMIWMLAIAVVSDFTPGWFLATVFQSGKVPAGASGK